MNGYYQCDDPLTPTKVKQKPAYASPHRSRAASRQSESTSKPPASAVWNVVSGLVQALSDARDELLTLLSSDGVRVTRRSDATMMARRHSCRSPSRSPSRSPGRPFSAPSDWRRSRSPIRSQGYYSGRISRPDSSDHQKSRTTTSTMTQYNPPVSFGMNLEFDSVRRGRSPPAGYRRPAGRYQPMTMSPQRGITPHGLEYFAAVPAGQGRRHCNATRFADLLEAETCQLRERRLAGESVAALRSRPSWY